MGKVGLNQSGLRLFTNRFNLILIRLSFDHASNETRRSDDSQGDLVSPSPILLERTIQHIRCRYRGSAHVHHVGPSTLDHHLSLPIFLLHHHPQLQIRVTLPFPRSRLNISPPSLTFTMCRGEISFEVSGVSSSSSMEFGPSTSASGCIAHQFTLYSSSCGGRLFFTDLYYFVAVCFDL